MRLLYRACYCIHRTHLGAGGTALALIFFYIDCDQRLAYAGRTFFVLYVGDIFVLEIAECSLYRVRCQLAEATE